jgi:ribonuclease PH
LRAIIDLEKLGERQIKIDCDVIRADGGTRTASITGAWVALSLAVEDLMQKGLIAAMPLRDQVAAISCGLVAGEALADLDYNEDSNAETDANFVLTASGGIVEIQGTAEQHPFSELQLMEMMALAKKGCQQLFEVQMQAVRTAKP